MDIAGAIRGQNGEITLYAPSFSNTGLSGSLMFTGCNRLVGGTDGFVWDSNKTAYAYLRIDTASTPRYNTAA